MSSQVKNTGATIESGLSDWQIIQRDEHGLGKIDLKGRWSGPKTRPDGTQKCSVQARLVWQDYNEPVTAALDWHDAQTQPEGTWQMTLAAIPAGGLYRLETRLCDDDATEWSTRGDMRHFVGVGDVWIIAGQSNSAGYGRGAVEDPSVLGAHLFRNSVAWALASHPMNESTDTQHVVNREGGNPGHSPYLAFGRELQRELGYPIGLIQTALGGSPLRRWNPTEEGPSDLFENMIDCVKAAGGGAKGVLWYQGESDANDLEGDSYAARFAAAVDAWRAALGDQALPVLTVQLNRVYQKPSDEGERGWSKVREAQRQVARTVKGVAVVPSLDLPLSDLVHISAAGNLMLGHRLALAALGMVYGRDTEWRSTDLEGAKFAEKRSSILLSFSGVLSRVGTIDVTSTGFKVVDGTGDIGIAETKYDGTTVTLVLQHAAEGRTVVHGAYGANPPLMAVDMDRLWPILGFSTVVAE